MTTRNIARKSRIGKTKSTAKKRDVLYVVHDSSGRFLYSFVKKRK